MYLRTAIFQSHQCRMYSICIYIHVYIYISYIVIHQEYYGIIIIVKQHVRFFRRVCTSKKKIGIGQGIPTLLLMRENRIEARADGADLKVPMEQLAKNPLETTGPPALVLLDLWREE